MNSRGMLKLRNLLQTRNQLVLRRLFEEDVMDTLRPHKLILSAGISTARQNPPADEKLMDRIYANYNIYKGKASLSVSPKLPTFSKLESGGLKVDRGGVIMLSFSPAIGDRKYDWEKKQLFALSATEVGTLISLGPNDSCEFFHDPSMKSSNSGQVRKTLSVKAYAEGTGYFISLGVVNNILKTNERLTVPVTTAEFAVMRTAFSYALPHIMGWDRYTNQYPNNKESNNTSKIAPAAEFMDSEWDR